MTVLEFVKKYGVSYHLYDGHLVVIKRKDLSREEVKTLFRSGATSPFLSGGDLYINSWKEVIEMSDADAALGYLNAMRS